MPNQFGLAGANPGKQTKFAPIYTGRWSSGIWTNRSPLRDAATSRIVEKFYGAAGDALIAGSNVEITNRLTLARRPGNTVYPTGNLPPSFSSVDRFYDFRLFNGNTEQIILMIDNANSLQALKQGSSIPQTVWSKSKGAGQTYMQSVGNTLYFGNGVDNKKWLQSLVQWTPNTQLGTPATPYMSTYLIDPNGNIQQFTGTAIPIGYVYVNNDVVEIITSYDLQYTLTAGQTVTFPQGMTASFLNGQTVTITVVGSGNFSNAFYFNFVAPNYPQTAESNKYAAIYPGDGEPFTGSTQPTWNTSIPAPNNNFAGGITYDGTAQWTNRGNPVENWGIAPPTTVLTPTILNGVQGWAANTFYSGESVVLDTNGNLQQVIKAGTSGASIVWSTSLGSYTSDGALGTNVVWKLIASAGMLNWQPSHFYANKSYLVENGCLFQLATGNNAPYLANSVSCYLYSHDVTGDVGEFDLYYPTTQGSAQNGASGLSGFNFTVSGTGTTGSFSWDTINPAGEVTGTTNPFSGANVSNINICVQATIQVPVGGEYTFSITHGDGLLWGMGGGAFLVSGSTPNNISRSTTAINGYPVFDAGNNLSVSANAGNAWVDTYVVDFVNPGAYPIEFNLARGVSPNAGLTVECNGLTLASGQTTGGGVSGSLEPIWPAWTLGDAPNYPSVTESSGLMVWNNIGPIVDFTWHASTYFNLPGTYIIDSNGFTQFPYETGKSGATSPVFSTATNALTADAPNLYWINQGRSTYNPAGDLTTSNGGWVYSISLVNTLDDTVSNATPISAPTGDFTNAIAIYLSPGDGLPPVSQIDPQADYVAIWRSTDGQVQPFLIPGNNDYDLPITLPLSQYLTYGYEDTTPDTGLNNLQEAPILGENTPPQPGAINLAYYLGRIFYSVGNVVYWTSGPEAPEGNGLNGTNPLNYDAQQSLVHRIVPTTSGALVFTVSDINIITATTSSTGTVINPAQAFPLLEGIGLPSYNALDTNGSIIGFFSTDSQFIIIDPANGISSAGFPIGDQFLLNNGTPGQSWVPANVYVAWHVSGYDQAWYVADGKNGWYRLMATPAPESGGYTWSPFATLSTGAGCVQSVETSPGVHQLLIGPVSTGHILARNLNSWVDGTLTYPANATIGSAVLAQPGQYAIVSFIVTESVRVGTPLVLSMLVDDAYPIYTGPFDVLKNWKSDPPALKPSRSILGQRFYMSELEDDASLCRHVQMQVSWAEEGYANELFTLTVYGGFVQEN